MENYQLYQEQCFYWEENKHIQDEENEYHGKKDITECFAGKDLDDLEENHITHSEIIYKIDAIDVSIDITPITDIIKIQWL